MIVNRQKLSGAYFTPEPLVEALVCWAVRNESDRLLDPSCGDGRFIAAHANSVGIEQEPESARAAIERAPWALVHEGDFFQWAEATPERFECCAGNPPFIRYQHFNGAIRKRALELCARQGARFSGLTSSWAPFLVAAASLLNPGGRMAFVVPAEIGHAPYAAPLLEYLVANFESVHIVAVREKLFPSSRRTAGCSIQVALAVEHPRFNLALSTGSSGWRGRPRIRCTSVFLTGGIDGTGGFGHF